MHGAKPVAPEQPDATEHAIQLLARENKILELVARGAALDNVLTEIAYAAESHCGDEVRCSILLLDESRTRLLHGAAPSLPKDYNDAVHGIEIGPEVGTCGKAAFSKQPVITPDLDLDPNWKEIKHLALPLGLRAAWSTPILSSQGEVLGTLGIYFPQPGTPSDRARQVVDLLARTAAIAIERHRSELQRVRYQKHIEKLNDTGILLAAERDLQKILQAATDTAREISGAAFGAFFYNTTSVDSETYLLYTISGAPREAFSKSAMPRNTAMFAPTFSGTETVRVANVRKDPRYGNNAPYHGIPEGHSPVCSYLAVPVIARSGKVFGALLFGHPDPNKFTEENERLVESIAAQAAVAIDNAQLNEGLARQLEESKEVQQRLAIAQQTAQLATWELDLRTNEICFSLGSWPVFGCELEKLKTRRDWEAQIHPDDRDYVRYQLEASLSERRDYFAEYRVLTPLGVRWVQGRGHAVFNEQTAAPERLIVLSIDITERKLSEEALRVSDQKFREAQKASNMGTWFWDIPSDKVTWSTEVPSFAAAVPSQSVKNWIDMVLPEDVPGVKAELARVLREGGAFRVENRLRKANGGIAWCFTQGQIKLDENKRPVSGIGITMDITAQKAAALELQRTQERFSLVVESADLGFWYCDLPFAELGWDTRVKEHFWLPADARVTIDDFYRILHPDDRARVSEALDVAIAEHKSYDIDYRTVSPAGEVKWIRAVGRCLYGSDGKPVSFDGVTMDITARRKGEEALRSSEKLAATGRLAATIAHEINNPLEAVTNFIYLAKTSECISPKVSNYLESADQELRRVSQIARQTLGFYRDTGGPKVIHVLGLVSDVVNLYQRKLMYKSLTVDVEVPPELEICGLAGEMRQVLSNLLLNAIDASTDEGRIRIRGRRVRDPRNDNEVVRITIGDCGRGMSPEVSKNLFTPFFTTKSDVGTGLGLWVTKGMVEKGQGRIGFRSRENRGTVFTLTFPASHA